MTDDLPVLVLPDADAWRAWLVEHHTQQTGVWLVTHKKGGSVTELTYDQAVDEALCFGWIDGQRRSRDEQSSLLRMTPRRPRSVWSAVNVERIARLEREGRMHDAGRAQVAAAQADGRWDAAYRGPASIEVPDDLAAALDAVPTARAWFDALTSANRFAVLYRVTGAKRAQTRARLIAAFVADLAEGRTVYPQKRRPDSM